MATHPTAVRNSIVDLVVDLIDAGAGAGTLEFQTAGDVEVATLTFSDPAFGAAASGQAAANAITDDASATGNASPVTKFVVKDSDGNEVFRGTAGDVGTEEIVLSNATIAATDAVSCSSLTYTAGA